jgi:phosphatidylglycerophosphate synthase
MFDIMDGMRARRTRCGSPLGRIIDEGGDMVTQACYCVLIAYCFGVQDSILEFAFIQINITFYFMEMRQVMTGKLVLIQDEIGPVEIELMLTLVLFSVGYFGPGLYQSPIGDYFGMDPESYTYISATLGHVFLLVFIILFIIFFFDDFMPCLRSNPKKTLYYCIPVLQSINMLKMLSGFSCFANYRILCYLLV